MMRSSFDYFVVFADMRTGSNFLESNLNEFDRLTCFGEAFNPSFIGYPNTSDLLGVTIDQRDNNPLVVIDAIKSDPSYLGGFRFFHDHDPRVLEHCLSDARCAKIILTRNPAESYVSLKIARETGQWKLTNVKRRRDAQIDFNADEFENHINQLKGFHQHLLGHLQRSGQTAFFLDYEDLQDVRVINGLARFLGAGQELKRVSTALKPQNPLPLRDKVRNFDDVLRAVSDIDRFDLFGTPLMEPRRGPNAHSFVAARNVPLLFMPVKSGLESRVTEWLADVDNSQVSELHTNMGQSELLKWKKSVGHHRSFTVIRHPVARIHNVFCRLILPSETGGFTEIRKKLRNFHKVPIPGRMDDKTYDIHAHRRAFMGFIRVVGANLNGQTSFRVDPHWATQSAIISGMAQFCTPDFVLREEDLATKLPDLAKELATAKVAAFSETEADVPFSLAETYDQEIEKLVAHVYRRDYSMFGFGPWSGDHAA